MMQNSPYANQVIGSLAEADVTPGVMHTCRSNNCVGPIAEADSLRFRGKTQVEGAGAPINTESEVDEVNTKRRSGHWRGHQMNTPSKFNCSQWRSVEGHESKIE